MIAFLTKYLNKIMLPVLALTFAVWIGATLNSFPDANESAANSNIVRSDAGNIARYVDKEYGIICYNATRGISCIAAPEVKK